jgi:hypothetical protein
MTSEEYELLVEKAKVTQQMTTATNGGYDSGEWYSRRGESEWKSNKSGSNLQHLQQVIEYYEKYIKSSVNTKTSGQTTPQPKSSPKPFVRKPLKPTKAISRGIADIVNA